MARFRCTPILLVFCMVASVLLAAPVSAQEVPTVDPADESDGPLPTVSDDPVSASVASASLPDLIIPEPVPTSESGRPGWVPQVAASRANPQSRVAVGDSPVSVSFPGSETGRARSAVAETSVVVNVLDLELADDISPFDTVASMSFLNGVGQRQAAPSAFELSFDLTDVSIGDAPGAAERLTMTRFVGCEVFEGGGCARVAGRGV